MRVLAINQFYAPDLAATAQLLTQLCEDLVGAGDEVTVIASRGGYLGGQRLAAEEHIGGVRVLRPWATGYGKRSVAHRLSDYLTFWASAVGRAAAASRPDVMLALTTPPMIAAGAALVARARGIPLVTWVQDVYPDIAVAFGVLPARHPLTGTLRLLGRHTHRAATRVVALSGGMAERLREQGAPADRLRVVANWQDGAAVRPMAAADNPFRREHGLEGRFVAMYSGNLGVGHDVATLVEAARLLAASHPAVLVLFVGDGSRRAEAEQLARGLDNVRFMPYQPRERLAESLSAGDVHLVSLRAGLEGLLVPSKFYGVLAAGRPVLYVGPAACEVSRLVRAHDLGWAVEPSDAAGLARALGAAADEREDCRMMGARARALLDRELDRPLATARWRNVLLEASSSGALARHPVR